MSGDTVDARSSKSQHDRFSFASERHLSSLVVWFMRAKLPSSGKGLLDISAESPEPDRLRHSAGRADARDIYRTKNRVHAPAALRQEIESHRGIHLKLNAVGGLSRKGPPNCLVDDDIRR
jgi:hypothetical protein